MQLEREKTHSSAMEKILSDVFLESIAVKQQILQQGHLEVILKMAEVLVHSLQKGGKLLLCGNGGSASDAQHLAAELLIRLRPNMNRQAIPAIALTLDSSTLTACGNDFGFDLMYERMVSALGNAQDVLLGITTSGRSPNVVKALKKAQSMGLITFGFLGNGGGEALEYCDYAFVVPSKEVGRIQEVHITADHALMEIVEESLLKNGLICSL